MGARHPNRDLRRFTGAYYEQHKGDSQVDEEITLAHNGVTYAASHTVIGDKLTDLPNSEERLTELRGIPVESATMVHVKCYERILTFSKANTT